MGDTKSQLVMGFNGVAQVPVCIPCPKTQPEDCGACNEDLECLGCGQKIGRK